MGITWFKEPKQAWLGLGALWIIGFIGALTRFIMAFFQVQISADLGMSRGFIALAWSTNLLIAALCAPLGGWLVDRYGPKKVMMISAFIGTLGSGMVVFGHQALVFFIGYGVISGLTGIGATTTYRLIFEWFHHHRAKATGLLASASSLGLAISTPIFVSASWLTWKDAFLASFTLGILVTLPTIYFGIQQAPGPKRSQTVQPQDLGPPAGEKVKKPASVRFPLYRSPHLPLLLVVAGALFTCGFNMGTVEMNLVAIHQLAHVTPSTIAVSMSVLGVMEIVGSLIFGYFMDRRNKLMMMTLLYGIRIVGFSLLFLHLGWSPVLFALAFGVTYLSAVPGGLLIANEHVQGQGKLTGWLLLFHQGGGILGSLVGGVAFDYLHNYQALIGVDVLLCTLVALSYALFYANRGRSARLSSNQGVTA